MRAWADRHRSVGTTLLPRDKPQMSMPNYRSRWRIQLVNATVWLNISAGVRYARIVHGWVRELNLNPAEYATHSIRRTKPTLIYRRTKNLRAVQLLLGHAKLESTVRYLGIEVDDALEIAEQTEV
jgi:site-specific recombinase XerD